LGTWAYQTPYEKLEKVTELLSYYNRPLDIFRTTKRNSFETLLFYQVETFVRL